MKQLQNFYLFSYRLIGFIFLIGLITSILWYSFSVFFFLGSSSWAIPFILSPNQENVLIHQEHILSVRQELLKEKIELETAKNTLFNKNVILKNLEHIQLRIDKSVMQEAQNDKKNSKIYYALMKAKAQNIVELNHLTSEIRQQDAAIDKELKTHLITNEEAISQRVALGNLNLSLVEAKIRVHELEQKFKDLNASAMTLKGSNTSLEAMEKVIKKAELHHQILSLKSEIYSLALLIKHLESVFQKRMNVLNIMEKSPYILATQSPVNVAFVPYKNLRHVKINSPVYTCYLDMILCYKVGRVTKIYQAEEYSKHPLFRSDIKGVFIGINYHHKIDAQKKLLFIHSKPLFI